MKTIFRIALLLLTSLAVFPAYAFFGCTDQGPTCVDGPSTKYIQASNCPNCAPVPVTRQCWDYRDVWSCYTGQQQNSCTAQDLTGCSLSGTTCSQYSGSTCVAWTAHYICNGDAQTTCTADVPPVGACTNIPGTTVCNQTYQNQCVNQTVSQECYAQNPPQCVTDSRCTLSSSSCADGSTGLCTTMTQNYTCSNTTQKCTEYTQSQCMSNLAHGLDGGTPYQPSNEFGKVESTIAEMEAIQKGATAGQVSVFAGQPESCEKPLIPLVGNLLFNNCCSWGLSNQGTLWFNKCTQGEIQLAAARRANLTVPLGSYCSQSIFLIGCVKQMQTDCVFDNVLAKAINIQGRQQLADMAAAGVAGAQTSAAQQFSYYASGPTGGWVPVANVNGSSVYAFQWPNYCTDPTTAENAITSDPTAMLCPASATLWFAACGAGGTCNTGNLPTDPRLGSNDWDLASVNPLGNGSYSISKYAVVTGVCNPGSAQCSYTVSAWPQGVGGQGVLRTDMSFPLYDGGVNQTNTFQLADDMFTPHSLSTTPTNTLPASVPLDVSTDGGNTFTTIQLPTNIPVSQNYQIPGTDVGVYGQCDNQSQQCDFRLTKYVTVTALSWGSAKNPNCSGFSVDQLAVLDFNKMDLSQWLSTLPAAAPPAQAALSAQATSDAQAFYNTYNTGSTAPASGGQDQPVLVATPSEVMGPGQVTAQVVSNWPMVYPSAAQNTDPVTSVTINWGDGSPSVQATLSGTAYVASHTYQVPSSANVTYTLTATLQAANSGQHVTTTQIVDYVTPPASTIGANEGQGGAGGNISTYTPAETPSGAMGNTGVPGVPPGAGSP